MYARNQALQLTALKCGTKSIIESEGYLVFLYCRMRSQQSLIRKAAGKLAPLVKSDYAATKDGTKGYLVKNILPIVQQSSVSSFKKAAHFE